MASLEDLIGKLVTEDVWSRDFDIKKLMPDISYDDAYRLQVAAKNRQAEKDPIIGYQASFTSAAAQSLFPDMPIPMVGTLLRSTLKPQDTTIDLSLGDHFVESEVGLVLKRDLLGPVSQTEARAAIEGVIPAMEVPLLHPGELEGAWSTHHMIARHNGGSSVILGPQMSAPTLDLRLEGVVVTVSGTVRGSACGVEAMGDPINVLTAMVNLLAKYEVGMKAGMIVITGSCVGPQRVTAGDTDARVDFTRLGGVSVRFAS